MNQPRYAIVADRLRAQISDANPGDKLPTHAQLADQFGVSEIVIRQALRLLIAEGLIHTRRGRQAGSYVTEPKERLVRVAPRRYRRGKGATTFIEEAATAGVQVDHDARTHHARADDNSAERLAVDVGDPVTETQYLVRMEGEPIAMSTTWEPLDLTADTDIEYPDQGPHGHHGIVDRFDTIGHHVSEVEEELLFRTASDDEARALGLGVGATVVEIAQAFRTADRVVAAAKIVYRPDRYRFLYRMPVPDAPNRAPELPDYDTGDMGPLGGLLYPGDR